MFLTSGSLLSSFCAMVEKAYRMMIEPSAPSHLVPVVAYDPVKLRRA